ncbi:MAG: hypothetical protein J1E98_14235 [Lachnospiraceae bacterium]|nr:hypothetical protein [Lachnospiraceae bacterium]
MYRSAISVWKRYVLTIEEPANYYYIGENKLRMTVSEHLEADFIIVNGEKPHID